MKAHIGVLSARLAEVQSRLGENLWRQGDLMAALEACRRALALDSELADAHANLGHVLSAQGDLDGALACYHRAIALTPELAEVHGVLGGAPWADAEFTGALEACRRAMAGNPELAGAYTELSALLSRPGDRAAALECYLRTAALPPDALRFLHYAALAHLLRGDLATGWLYYEYRWHLKNYCLPQRSFVRPLWRGEPLHGARIFLRCEQGFGDMLQFARYVPLVAARGGEVILEVHADLYHLLAGMEGAADVVAYGDALPEFTWHCPLLSLPFSFGTELESIPARVPYLRTNPEETEKWSLRISQDLRIPDEPRMAGARGVAGEKLRVGLVWAGSPKHVRDRERSISLSRLAPLAQVNACFFSLQKSAAAEVRAVPAGMHFVDYTAELYDFVDTAALLSNLDLLITVDTAMAHLAGALGKPVWVLLTHAPDWRWMLNREDSPWYPSMRLFRQPAAGDWDAVIERVAEELVLFANQACIRGRPAA